MNCRRVALAALIPFLFVATACSQSASDIHPEKQAYLSWEEWPLVAPADVELQDFRPFSASYQRFFRGANGERQDWMVLDVQEASWYGEPALIVSLHGTGNAHHPDTAMRSQIVYLRKSDMSLLQASAPTSGTAHDLDVVRVLDDRVVRTVVRSESGESESVEFETDAPLFWGQRFGFGSLNYLVWGAMDLSGYTDFRFDRVYFPSLNTAGPALVRNRGIVPVEDARGNTHNAHLLETTLDGSSNSVSQWYIVNQAPYLIATARKDVTNGEIRWSRKLDRLVMLDK